MDLALQQRCNGRVDEPMTLELRTAAKCGTHQAHAKVTAGARARVPCVRRAVIADLKGKRRKLRFERGAQSFDALGAHAPCAALVCRDSHAICAPMNTNVAAVSPNTLKLTQARSLALKATKRLRTPSSA